MGSRLTSRIAPTVAALAIAASPALAVPKDYSMNGATGDYAAPVVHKNYALNGATGDYTPQIKSAPTVAPVVTPVDDNGFAWSDAAIGAGIALLGVFIVAMTSRWVRRRRIAAPSPARPTTV